MTAYKYWVSGITCHIYLREERTRLTGEINDMSAFIPGAERYFRRSLHVKNCRDRLIISSGFQEKGGCPLIRACSVITSLTVFVIVVLSLNNICQGTCCYCTYLPIGAIQVLRNAVGVGMSAFPEKSVTKVYSSTLLLQILALLGGGWGSNVQEKIVT